MKFPEGLLYEPVITALGCGTVGDGEGAARYDLRVLVMDQVPYGPYVPVRQPVVLPFIQVCQTSAASARIFHANFIRQGINPVGPDESGCSRRRAEVIFLERRPACPRSQEKTICRMEKP